MYPWSMLRMMFLRVIWMHPMCHVSTKHKTSPNSPVIFTHPPLLPESLIYSLSNLSSHIGVSPLCRCRSHLFVIKQHHHINLVLILRLLFLVDKRF